MWSEETMLFAIGLYKIVNMATVSQVTSTGEIGIKYKANKMILVFSVTFDFQYRWYIRLVLYKKNYIETIGSQYG